MPFLGTTGAASVKQFGGQANLGYFIRNSLRFRASNSAYLSRTTVTPTTATKFTLSFWMKNCNVTTSGSTSYDALFSSPTHNTDKTFLNFNK